MDTSNFHPDSPLYSLDNKGKFGLFKSEVGDRIVREIIALSPKVYSLVEEEGEEARIVRHKGIPSRIVNKVLKHDLYREALYHFGGTKSVAYKNICAQNFVNYTSNNSRASLNRCNMKRKFTSSQLSVPWGYHTDVSPYRDSELIVTPPPLSEEREADVVEGEILNILDSLDFLDSMDSMEDTNDRMDLMGTRRVDPEFDSDSDLDDLDLDQYAIKRPRIE